MTYAVSLRWFGYPLACVSAAVLWSLAGCSTSGQPAPVIDRSNHSRSETTGKGAVAPAVVAAPGTYIVKKGDTLYSVALETGHDWRDLASWNNLENPNRILVGQTLRTTAPTDASAAVAVAQPISSGTVEVRPIDSPGGKSAKEATKEVTNKEADANKTSDSKPKPDPAAEPDMGWVWPVAGSVFETFMEGKNKGIDIAAKAGDAVTASADGKVVYAGNALRGYGNLVIIKHNALFLSAYAHNRTLLVKEGEVVKKSQKIAEVGNTDSDRVKLHFEIRKQGRPVDPLKYLPAR